MSIPPVSPVIPLITPAAPAPADNLSVQAVTPVQESAKAAVGDDDRRQLEQALDVLARSARAWDTHLSFEIDDDSGRVIIRVIDNDSGEVVRQIPADEALRLAREGYPVKDLAFRSQG